MSATRHEDDPPMMRLVLDRLSQQDRTLEQQNKVLADIQKNTNGRLTKIEEGQRTLELWRARVEGGKAAFRWMPTLVSAILGSGVGALIAVLASSHP